MHIDKKIQILPSFILVQPFLGSWNIILLAGIGNLWPQLLMLVILSGLSDHLNWEISDLSIQPAYCYRWCWVLLYNRLTADCGFRFFSLLVRFTLTTSNFFSSLSIQAVALMCVWAQLCPWLMEIRGHSWMSSHLSVSLEMMFLKPVLTFCLKPQLSMALLFSLSVRDYLPPHNKKFPLTLPAFLSYPLQYI